jgi:chaperonin GroES
MAKKLNIRPLRDRLIVKRLEEEAKTKGGIIIPDSRKETQEGEVMAVGSGRVNEDGKHPHRCGWAKDLFFKYSGTEIN